MKIVLFDLTGDPCREFVKQRIQLLAEDFPGKKTLIYDNALQFWKHPEGSDFRRFSPQLLPFKCIKCKKP